jgi:lipoyl(octanoyl) transferase
LLPKLHRTWDNRACEFRDDSPKPLFPARAAIVTLTCQIVPYEIASGPTNMALDEALLDQVSTRRDVAYLRTYGWTVPTLSLGYFQQLAQAGPRWQSVPLVRRATGGGAIWHHHELTYALALPAKYPRATPNTTLYRTVHAAIAAVLHDQGLDVCPRSSGETTNSGQRAASRPFLCFCDRDPEDLVASGTKVVGSAQRRRLGAILQHGSILLSRSEKTPDLPGICDLGEVPPQPGFWAVLVEQEITRSLGLAPVPCDQRVHEELRHAARELERTVYATEGWTARRR